ncbi:hypothetical protein ADEAN_000117000 [Angomonas deanei]|uniref:C3H1-type domain-containing protein n=1 Tax=Angomonas deanei TaxID=59799 RepID=A0A7G2C4Q4_9TRYP|nr:hypothetical protein ADEAN_000117000 [Angomonas deanei]
MHRLFGPALRPAHLRKSGKPLNSPHYYYEKVLAAMPINDDPNYLQYSYEKYEPYQFRVQKCPHYVKGDLDSCRYGKNCFYYHCSRNHRSVEVNMLGNLASVQDVLEWLRVKNNNPRRKPTQES